MATRRSRIKAVANLPARRTRPAAPNDIKKESLDCVEEDVSPPSSQAENESCIKDLQAAEKEEKSFQEKESTKDSQTAPDRKTVIVTVEKDRKSVIVNKDDCTSSLVPTSIQENAHSAAVSGDSVNDTLQTTQSSPFECQSAGDGKGTIEKPVGDISSGITGGKPDGKAPSDVTSSASVGSKVPPDSNATLNKRVPARIRRAKPTVNLTAAARKRPASDLSTTSPCSPPPSKMKSSELFHRKVSESQNSNETTPCTNPDESNAAEAPGTNDQTDAEVSKTLVPSTQNSETHPSKASSSTDVLFKTPLNPSSKSKDYSSGTSNDHSSKGDSTTSGSPPKDPSSSKRKPSPNAQKVAAARKSLKSRLSTEGAPARASLTMFDLIFYNPTTNPMKSTDSLKKPRSRLNSVASVSSSIHEDRLNEESVDDVETEITKEDGVEETVMPVPQVKVGPDGNLILDEQSLVIETTGTKKSREDLEKSEVVVDTGSGYGHYKKIIRSKDWSDHETKKFYRALNVVGTDFSLMKPYFRKRTRRELKLKFKKEERLNPKLINKALAEPLDFDISELEKECELEDEEEKRLEEEQEKEKSEDKVNEDAADVKEKIIKKPAKKRKPKGSKLLAEMELEVENSSAVKIAPKIVAKKRSKKSFDVHAEEDYQILAGGVQSAENNCSKETPVNDAESASEAEYSILVDLPENINKSPVKRVQKKKNPVSEEGQGQEPKTQGADCSQKEKPATTIKTIKRKPTKLLSETASENIPVSPNKDLIASVHDGKVTPTTPPISNTQVPQKLLGSNIPSTSRDNSIPGAQVITTANLKIPPGTNLPGISLAGVKVITGAGQELRSPTNLPGTSLAGAKVITNVRPPPGLVLKSPTNLSGISLVGAKVISAANLRTTPGLELKNPTNLAGISLAGGKVISTSPLSRIQIVQGSPLSSSVTPPVTGVGMTTPRTIQIINKQFPLSQPLPVPGNKSSVSEKSSCMPSSKLTQSTSSSQTVQVHTSSVTSTCIVSTPVSKSVPSTPSLSRIRTVQVTPQSVSNLSSFGVSTPVSRLLPSTPSLPRMEPGSIIVLKTPLPQDPERHVLQVYMVTNTPQGSSPNTTPLTPNLPGISLLSGPSVQPATNRSPCVSEDSDCEKVLTKL